MTIEEMQIKLGELAMYARQKGWDDDYTEAVNKVDDIIEELQSHRKAWEKVRSEIKTLAKDKIVCEESSACDAYYDALNFIDKYKPRDGDIK